ncbi:hypothetical protein F5I97DRAFT_2027537, partial [Phlebopus sp. FC_14]
MAFGKWIQFGQQVPPTIDIQVPQPLPIPCADGKQFGLENALYFCSPFRDLVIQHTDPYASLQQALASQFAPANIPGSPVTHTRRKPERKATNDSSTPNGVAHPPTPPVPSAPRTLFSALRALYIHISQNPADRGTVAPRAFIEKLRELNEAFRSTMHQDAHEFLNYLLNRIVEEIEEEKKHRLASGDDLPGSVKSSSTASQPHHMTASSSSSGSPSDATFVHQIFEGVLTSETRCLTCESVSSREESFLDLSIDIAQNSSVTACLRQFSASEMLCQKDKFFCDSCCELQEAEKRMKIKRLPNVLALHLKRFKYQEDVQKYIKLTYRVAFPLELRLFNTVDDCPNPDRLFELFAIVVHIGNGPNHGHYVSIIKTMGTWLVFDDETVDTIKEGDIPKYFGESNSGSAYVLYYQAVDLDLTALGLRPPSPEPEQVLKDAQHQLHPTDSPVSASPAIPPLPPGLTGVSCHSTGTQENLPPSLPTQEPSVPQGKSPRKAPSQLLKVSLSSSPTRAATLGPGASPISESRNGSLRPPARSNTPGQDHGDPVSKSGATLFPNGDAAAPDRPPPPAPVNGGKEKEPERKVSSWFRRKSLKGGAKRPTLEAGTRDRPPLPPDVFLGTASSAWFQTNTSSSPNGLRRPSEPAVVDHAAPTTSRRPMSSYSMPRVSSEKNIGKLDSSPSLPSSPAIPVSPSSDRYSHPRPLPAIPASPQGSKMASPPSAYPRASSDHARSHRRHGMPVVNDFEPPRSPRSPTRPATAAGEVGSASTFSSSLQRSLPPPPSANGAPLDGVHSGNSMSMPRPDKGKAKGDPTPQSQDTTKRPKSSHASPGFGMSSQLSASTISTSASSNIKRATRKLSFTAPMLGLGRRDKDKAREKEKDNERERSSKTSVLLSP